MKHSPLNVYDLEMLLSIHNLTCTQAYIFQNLGTFIRLKERGLLSSLLDRVTLSKTGIEILEKAMTAIEGIL